MEEKKDMRKEEEAKQKNSEEAQKALFPQLLREAHYRDKYISAKQLTEEIRYALNVTFEARILSCQDDRILMFFPNSNNFEIKVTKL